MRRLGAVLALLLPAPLGAQTLAVSAASSLTDALREVGAAWERSRPGASVTFNFAGSQLLRAQIEQGAPVDLFAAADATQMKPLRDRGLVGEVRVFARNQLVVAASPRSGVVRALGDLVRPGTRVVVAGPTVPAGRYTLEALSRLDHVPGWGPGFSARVQANVVSQETSVRAVLAKVLLGEADAGFVYRTDAAGSDRVLPLELPELARVTAEYPVALVNGTLHPEAAASFLAFLLGQPGREILARHGFAP